MASSPDNSTKLNLLERVVSTFNAPWALENAVSRSKLHQFEVYEAARTGTNRGGSGGQVNNAVSESWQGQRDRIKLMWLSRKAERDIPFIKGVLDKDTMYTCNNIRYHAGTGVAQIDEAYESHWNDWCERADIAGRMHFNTLVELLYRSFRRDGDAGWNLVTVNRELRIQFIEADRIGSPTEAVQAENYYGGITVDKIGKIETFRIFQRSKTGQYVNPQEIPASRFVHLMRHTRADQYRGVTPLACILPKAQDLHEWMQITMQAGKTAAIWAAFVEVTDPNKTTGGVAWRDSNDPGGMKTMDAKSGLISRMAPGEKVTFSPGTTQPSGQFTSFTQALIREMAIGLNRPYGYLYNLAELGGVNSRIELMQAWRGVRQDQTLIERIALNRTKNEVIAGGIAARRLPPHPRWRQGRWTFGAWLTGDVGYQTAMDKDLVRMGVKPIDAWAAELDYDYIQNARQNAGTINSLREIVEESGTPIEMLAPDWQPQATQLLAAANTPPSDPPPPPPGLIGELGDKGVNPLVDILEKVSSGQMDRDSAVQALIQIYGWPFAKADAVVPQQVLPQPENPDLY